MELKGKFSGLWSAAGDLVKASVTESVQARPGWVMRGYHCRRPAGSGGLTVHLGIDDVERIIDWAVKEGESDVTIPF
jgi:hypothetical protein